MAFKPNVPMDLVSGLIDSVKNHPGKGKYQRVQSESPEIIHEPEQHELHHGYSDDPERNLNQTIRKKTTQPMRISGETLDSVPGKENFISRWLSLRSQLRVLYVALSFFIVATLAQLWAPTHALPNWTGLSVDNNNNPFSGAFQRFPTLSSLSADQRRLTIVGVWNDDYIPSYLRHYLYTTQLNADSIDLLLINRIKKKNGKCVDFEAAGIDITWGGNIDFHCITDEEYHRRYVDFMCSKAYGWNCTEEQHTAVAKEFGSRKDDKNYNWRPLRGWVFRDLIKSSSPYWAWMDLDLFVGDMRRYPFNILSEVSFVAGTSARSGRLMLAGQLTAFNFEDPSLGSAWKRFPELQTPEHFTEKLEGKFYGNTDEGYWSVGYLRSNETLPGYDLSWVSYPDLHGDDAYHGHYDSEGGLDMTYAISGRDILVVPASYSREAIEATFTLERKTPVDDLGNIGWTTGEDGSALLLEEPDLDSETAVARAIGDRADIKLHEGVVQSMTMGIGCWNKWTRQCIPDNPLTSIEPPLFRMSVVHFREQRENEVLLRFERDDRNRGYERKLIRHMLLAKRKDWYALPDFDITDKHVLLMNNERIEVFRMGKTRDETLFHVSANVI